MHPCPHAEEDRQGGAGFAGGGVDMNMIQRVVLGVQAAESACRTDHRKHHEQRDKSLGRGEQAATWTRL